MSLADVYLVSPHRQLLSEEELNQFESKLGFELPKGYREYMTVLGKGKFCHNLKVRTPEKILKPDEVKWWRESMVPLAIEEGLWEGRMLLDPEELKESLVIASSDEGDYFVSTPLRPGELFEFPRHENKMYHYQDGFLDPFAFEFCRVGKYNLPFFEPERSREFDFTLELAEGADVWKAWEYVAKVGSQPLRVAEGEIGKTDRVVAFIPDISGCAWMDNPSSIYFFCINEHADRLKKLRQDLAHLEKPSK